MGGGTGGDGSGRMGFLVLMQGALFHNKLIRFPSAECSKIGFHGSRPIYHVRSKGVIFSFQRMDREPLPSQWPKTTVSITRLHSGGVMDSLPACY